MGRMTDDKSKRKRKRDKNRGRARARVRVVRGRQECAGRAPAEPSIQAGLTSETGNLSCMLHHLPHRVLPLSSLLNRSPQPSSLFGSTLPCGGLHFFFFFNCLSSSAHHDLLIQDLSASTTSCCQFIIFGQGWLHPALSAHSHPFTTTHSLHSCVCVCVHLWLSVCEHASTSMCVLCTACLACLLKLLFWMEVGVLWRPVPCDLRVTRLGYRICLGVTASCGTELNPQPPLLISHSAQSKIPQQPAELRAVLCSSLGLCLYSPCFLTLYDSIYYTQFKRCYHSHS